MEIIASQHKNASVNAFMSYGMFFTKYFQYKQNTSNNGSVKRTLACLSLHSNWNSAQITEDEFD